jgi:cytochrome c oxidase subunit 2
VPGDEPAVRPRRGRAARVLPRVLMLAAVLASTAGCTQSAWMRLGMPAPVTKQGKITVSLWQGSWVAALCVGAVVWGLILWAVVFHRKRGDQPPMQVRYNLPIEMLYTVVPFIMVGVLFFFTARDENSINKLSAHPDVVVNVTGYQWSWQFQYPQYKVGGAGDVVTVNGQPWSPSRGNKAVPVMVIPENESVRFNLVSTDVVHSFWIPPFEFKRDLIPGHPNHFQVTPDKTGYFLGHCTELCGLYHSRMIFYVKIVTPAQFSQWIHAQQAQQATQATSAGGVS